MFSGIIEQTATVVAVRSERQNKHFTLRADFCRELKIDQSIAHNGVCLTVVDLTEDTYTVTAMKETLLRSNLGALQVGDLVNVERVKEYAAEGRFPYKYGVGEYGTREAAQRKLAEVRKVFPGAFVVACRGTQIVK